MLAREVEIAWTALPASVPGAQGVAEHWRRVAQIGCINFGCDDERVKQWRNRAGDAAMPAATAKPYEAQYAIGADIVAKAQAAANAGAAPAKP
jgi:hypothetical protein